MQLKVASIHEGKTGEASGSDMALTSQPMLSNKGKGKAKKRDLTDMTCYGCSKKGHLKQNCPDKSKGGDMKDKRRKTISRRLTRGRRLLRNQRHLPARYTPQSAPRRLN